jgi:hypothetical protein
MRRWSPWVRLPRECLGLHPALASCSLCFFFAAFVWAARTQLFSHPLPVLCVDYAISKPDILTRIERGEKPCPEDQWGQEKGSEEEATHPPKLGTGECGQSEKSSWAKVNHSPTFLGEDNLGPGSELRPLTQGGLCSVQGHHGHA